MNGAEIDSLEEIIKGFCMSEAVPYYPEPFHRFCQEFSRDKYILKELFITDLEDENYEESI